MTEQDVSVRFNADIGNLEEAMQGARDSISNAFNLDYLNAQGSQQTVNTLFSSIQRSSDAAIRGLIRGTETWQSAFYNVASNLEVRFAQLAARRLLGWVQNEMAMTSVSVEQNALRLASDEQGGAASLASRAQNAIASINNDAQEVFGGIFAFLSPTMGPAAAGPAAAGSASVSALASGITFAETGAWHIPDNTLAYLHAGEMVVPRPFADSVRAGNGFGGGGDSYNVTIQAIDTQTGAQFLKNNAAAIASALSSQVRNFNRQVWSLKN